MRALFALGVSGLLVMGYSQVLVWQETFDDPGATSRWSFGPTPAGLALAYSNDDPGHNYFV
ncbi:MAG: hypothetical protein RML92_08170, partial [Bacteroidia bacterium]|nr:hypothetical protein [Bacteroidia bacterium]